MDISKEIINKIDLVELHKNDQAKYTIKILEDLIKNYSYMEWDNPQGERVVHTETIKEKIEELKITLIKH